MKLERWALVAEIVGGLAIVVTLVFLIYETRQSTAATYAASYDQLSAEMADWRMALANNPEMQANYFRFAFTDDERQGEFPYEDTAYETGVIVSAALYLIYERAYFAREYGRLGDEEWNRYSNSMCDEFSRRIWPRLGRDWYTDEFVSFVDACQER